MNDGREGLLYRVCFWLSYRDPKFFSYRETSGRALRSARVVCARGVRFPRYSEILVEWARGRVGP